MSARQRTVAAALLLGVGAAGCGSSGGSAPAETSLPRPFQGVTYYNQQQATALQSANENLVARCMSGRGFTYRQQKLTAGPRPQDKNPYGLLTVAQAAMDGYTITSVRLGSGMPPDANRAESTNAKWTAALLGSEAHRVHVKLPEGQEFYYNADSCVTDAETRLFGADYDRLFNSFQVLTNRVLDSVHKDQRFLAAQGKWRTCMQSAGESAATPDASQELIARQLQQVGKDPGKLRSTADRELRLSAADAHCQEQSHLARAVTQAQADAEATTLVGHTDDLARLRVLRDTALAKATPPQRRT